jgi:hypothetical protein
MDLRGREIVVGLQKLVQPLFLFGGTVVRLPSQGKKEGLNGCFSRFLSRHIGTVLHYSIRS